MDLPLRLERKRRVPQTHRHGGGEPSGSHSGRSITVYAAAQREKIRHNTPNWDLWRSAAFPCVNMLQKKENA